MAYVGKSYGLGVFFALNVSILAPALSTSRSGSVGNSFHAAARRVAYQVCAVVHSDGTTDTPAPCGTTVE
jgi:hypothetical protein